MIIVIVSYYYHLIRDFTRDRQLMMIGVQILLRTMVYQAVLRPKPREDQKLELNENSKANVMLFASILYHIIIGIWRRIPSDPGSQNHLRKLDKVKPGAPLFVGKDPVILHDYAN